MLVEEVQHWFLEQFIDFLDEPRVSKIGGGGPKKSNCSILTNAKIGILHGAAYMFVKQ